MYTTTVCTDTGLDDTILKISFNIKNVLKHIFEHVLFIIVIRNFCI